MYEVYIAFFTLDIHVMKKLLFAIVGMAMIALMPSCTTVKHLSFERLHSAEVSFPEQVQRVGVVNCSPVVSEWVWVHQMKNSYEGVGQATAESFAQEVAGTNYFNQVVICDSIITPLGADASLSSAQKDSLIRSLDVDMLFTVEKVLLDMSTDKVWFPELMQSIPVLRIGVTPLIGAYKEGREAPIFKVCRTDTMYWELPLDKELDQVVRSASEYAGTIPMKHLLPYWEEVHRFYFDGGNAEIRDAAIYVREENWEAAAELWKTIYERNRGKYRMHAAFNLALYHEMKDEYEPAREYLEKAFELSAEGSSERSFIQYYHMQLEAQQKQNKMLQIQMKRFE